MISRANHRMIGKPARIDSEGGMAPGAAITRAGSSGALHGVCMGFAGLPAATAPKKGDPVASLARKGGVA